MVALKCTVGTLENEEAQAPIQKLAAGLEAVSNPHVIPAEQLLYQDNWGVGASSTIPGLLLGEVLQQGEKFSPTQALRVITDLATGLQALHDGGIAHGDVTPENIVLIRQNRAQLLGAGLHAAVNPPQEQWDSGQTPAPYMPPECVAATPTPGSDLYGLGLILYELLTGRQAAATVAGYNPGARDSLVPRLPTRFNTVAPHLPRALETLTFSLLQTNPADRCASANEFRENVHRLVKAAQRRRTPRPAG